MYVTGDGSLSRQKINDNGVGSCADENRPGWLLIPASGHIGTLGLMIHATKK